MKKGDFLSEEEKKKSSFGAKLKESIVCKFNKGLAVGLSALIFVAGGITLAGCATEVSVNEDPVPTERIEAVLDDMKMDNYSYSYNSQDKTVDYLLSNNKAKTVSNNREVYYYVENGESFNLTYDQRDSLWHKTEAEKFDFDSIIYNDLASATWSAYDESTKEFSGKMNGNDVTLEIESNGAVTLQGDNFEGTIYNIGNTTVNLPDKSIILDETIDEIPMEDINKLLAGVEKGNYSYSEKINGKEVNYLLAGDTWKVYEGDDNIGYYYYVEDGKAYLLNYDKTDNMWHKTETELRDSKEFVYDDLLNAIWTDYDVSKDIYTGEINGKEVNLEFLSSGAMIYGTDYQKTVYSIGETTVNLPEPSKIVDDTVIIDPPPVVETDKIYTVDENGNYVFNITAMATVLDDWLKGNNQYKKDYLAEYWLVSEDVSHVNKILYIDADLDNIDVVVISETNGKGGLTTLRFNDANFYEKLKSGEIDTTEEFRDYLNSTKYKQFSPEGSTITFEYSTDSATAQELSEFKAMTENILTKIATKGIQSSSVRDPYQDAIPEYEDAKVLFGFKTPASGSNIGADLGNIKYWNHYYILSVNDKLEFVEVTLISSIDFVSNEKENVINGNDKGYIVQNVERKEINNNNKELFNSKDAQTVETLYYITEKEREL